MLIDFDPQASLSCSLGIDAPGQSVFDLVSKQVPLDKVIVKKGKMSVVPASMDLSGFDNQFHDTPGKELILKKVLTDCKGFDFVLIDCPPSLGLLTINALAAAHKVYIPLQTEFLALQGLGQLLDTLSVVTKRINKSLEVGGITCTRYNRRKINKDVMQYLIDNFKDKAFKTVIRENVALTEAPSFGKDIFTHSPESSGAEDYFALSKEILAREVTR